MNLKYIKVISFFLIFLLSFLAHFMFDLFPVTFVSFFFPVNESIWEHMKILYTSIICSGLIEFLLFQRFKISYHNFWFQLFLSAYFSIILYLIIYLPIYYFFGEYLLVSILLMALVYLVVVIVSYFVMRMNDLGIWNLFSIVFLVWGYVVFIYFTYSPLDCYLFYDTLHQGYGIIPK